MTAPTIPFDELLPALDTCPGCHADPGERCRHPRCTEQSATDCRCLPRPDDDGPADYAVCDHAVWHRDLVTVKFGPDPGRARTFRTWRKIR